MNQSHWSRTAIGVVLGLIGALLIYLSFPVEKHSVQGIALPGKIVRDPSNPDDISLHSDLPFSAQPLGLVHLALRIEGDPSDFDEQQMRIKARELAAKLGANGIVQQAEGVTGDGPFHVLIFNGIAIYMPRGGL